MASRQKPIIGLNADFVPDARRPYHKLYLVYTRAIELAGGIPVVIPVGIGADDLRSTLDRLDGLVLTGGRDIDPALYGEARHETVNTSEAERQEADMCLARAALAHGLPIVGICLGCQLINVALGGSLVQDINTQTASRMAHGPSGDAPCLHPVKVVSGSLLHSIVRSDSVEVDSSHHQAVKRLGGGVVVTASAEDGTVEAIEVPGSWVVALQWHPERQTDSPEQMAIFVALVCEARKFLARRGS